MKRVLVIALLVAACGGTVPSSMPSVTATSSTAAAVTSVAPTLASTSTPATSGGVGEIVHISAITGPREGLPNGVKYEQTAVTAKADAPFRIEFENKDLNTPHNVAIHKDSPTGPEVFKGEIFNGVATQTYDVPALSAGAYAFACTVHPTMTGTLTVQ